MDKQPSKKIEGMSMEVKEKRKRCHTKYSRVVN